MQDEKGLRECEFCGQMLGHCAYYRHCHDINGLVCPGRVQLNDSNHSNFSDLDFDGVSECAKEGSDSSFNFGSESENSCKDIEYDVGMDHVAMETDSNIDSAEEEEIWQTSSEDESNQSKEKECNTYVKGILQGIFLFFYFFQLFYRISERAMKALLGFFQILLGYLSSITECIILKDLASAFPKSLYSIRISFHFSSEDIIEYVVCPRCSALYDFNDCIVETFGKHESKSCNHIEFPNHPHVSKQTKCGTTLLKKIKLCHKSKLIPKKSFIYNSLISALKKLVQRPHFLSMCEHWRKRSSKFPTDFLGDVYEGQVWKSLNVVEKRPFLVLPNNLCLCLNVDWFNPYGETPYSAGAIYLTILNLPRTEWYKLENIILVGIMPGPHEPKYCNSFLKPMVDDFKTLYEGVNMNSSLLCAVCMLC